MTPSKTGAVNGIASADASRVAQYAAGLVTLTANQLIAADASGNGTVSSLDASRIAQYIVGLNPTGVTGTWKFAPASKSYSSISTDLTGEDYSAIMVGDVTGNWTNPPAAGDGDSPSALDSGLPGLFGEELFKWNFQSDFSATTAPIEVTVGEVPQARTGEIVVIPVRVGDITAGNVTAFDLEVWYDARALRPAGSAADQMGTLATNFAVAVNPNTRGRLKVAAYGVTQLIGSGDLIYLTFEVIRPVRARPLRLEKIVLNEGEIPSKVTSDR